MKYNQYLFSNWEDRAQTLDENEMVNYIVNNCEFNNTQLLHIGIGSNQLWHTLVDTKGLFKYTGITYCILEYERVLPLHSPNYIPILINKYNPILSDILKKYDFICDNNIVSYADSDTQGLDYFKLLLDSLNRGGRLLSHELGLNYMRPANVNTMLKKLNLYENFSVTLWNGVVIIEKL